MITTLYNRRILLIISGGIAAYKSLELIRRLREAGAVVRCVLTKGGSQFVTPLSVSALSGNAVYSDLWSLTDEQEMGHIRLSRESDLIVVAPASANLMAKMAQGLADDLASTILLATNKPVLLAPAMNVMMWQNEATQSNVQTLRARKISIVGPAAGVMACGEEGEGRMSDPAEILTALQNYFSVVGDLKGKRALVTSGPTFEPLDPVRFIGNRSSGKQGHAIAAALAQQGAETILVSGPTNLIDPGGVRTIHVETAQEMLATCEAEHPFDIAVCAAAVADWRPAKTSAAKLKKGTVKSQLDLAENPDILANLSKAGNQRPRLVIGFAAETENLIFNATQKIDRKGCDWLVANEVGEHKVFGREENEVTLLKRDANGNVVNESWPLQSKENVARQLVEEIITFFKAA